MKTSWPRDSGRVFATHRGPWFIRSRVIRDLAAQFSTGAASAQY
jgi:hypothetical protein